MPQDSGIKTVLRRLILASGPAGFLSLALPYDRISFVNADFSATATITGTATDAKGDSVSAGNGDITWTAVCLP